MPSEALSDLAFKLLDALLNNQMTGYILAILITVLWYNHARKSRKEYSQELKRMGLEKSKLQGNAVGTTYPTSDNI